MMYIVHVRVALARWTIQIDEPNADNPNADFYTQPTVCLERGAAPPTTTTEYRVALVYKKGPASDCLTSPAFLCRVWGRGNRGRSENRENGAVSQGEGPSEAVLEYPKILADGGLRYIF